MRYSALLLAACMSVAATPTPETRDPHPPGPIAFHHVGTTDSTVAFTARSARPGQATGIEWTVSAVQFSTAGWSGLPVAVVTAGDTIRVVARSTSWDSVVFRVTAYSRRGAERSTGFREALTPVFRRPLGPPGPITIDTTLRLAALRVWPRSVTVAPGGQQQFCALFQFADGRWALPAQYQQTPVCLDGFAATAPPGMRATTAQQAVADTLCHQWTATGGTITTRMCGGGSGPAPAGRAED
jgi:hypothetical protein